MKTTAKYLAHLGLALLVLWFALAGFVWQIRNPTGNRATFWTHLPDAMCLRKLEKFQPRE